MKNVFSILCIVFIIVALAGCSKTYQQSDDNINKIQQQMKHAQQVASHPQPPVLSKPGYYVDAQPIALNTKPQWLSKSITLKAHNMPFNLLMNRLLRNTKVIIHYDQTVKPQQTINMDYKGTIEGALNALSATTNYHYTIHPSDISWSAFMTKTFNISFMPGASSYLVGQQRNSGIGGTTENAASPLSQINNEQFSNLAAQLSIWKDLRETLGQFKSPEGKLTVSESTTSVTVYDHPSNVRAIENYILALNKNLSQQVAIKVQVLEIALDKEFNYGINWNLVVNALDTRFNLIGNLGSATNLSQNTLILQGGNSAVAGLKIGKLNGPQTLISVLSQQGKVRVVTQPQVVTMNNQIASIRITRNVGYVESVSQSLSQNFLTTSITPGSITDGFSLYILPKIQNNKIFMQISSTIANLEQLQKVSTSANNNDAQINNNNNQQQFEAIQVPTLAQKAFNQRSVVTSGSTLIIAGYKRLRDEVDKASYFGIDPLGGKGARTKNVETLVLITPVILHSSQSNVHINT